MLWKIQCEFINPNNDLKDDLDKVWFDLKKNINHRLREGFFCF